MLNNSYDILTLEPLVSVGIPTCNRPDTLRRTLECITGQTHKNLEIIVSDNCLLGPETEAVVQEFMEGDKRIRFYRQDIHKGMMLNFQFVLKKATGDYFMWAAEDDEWDETYIESLLKPLLGNEKMLISFCPFAYMDISGNKIKGTHNYDYSSSYRIIRLIKLCYYYDDLFLYGIHRRKNLKNVKFPRWWGVNSKSVVNTVYPIIFYLLTFCDLTVVGSSPKFFYRLKGKSKIHYQNNLPIIKNFGFYLYHYIKFVFWKINVFYECEKSIWNGSKSITIVSFMIVPLMFRFFIDCIKELIVNFQGLYRIL